MLPLDVVARLDSRKMLAGAGLRDVAISGMLILTSPPLSDEGVCCGNDEVMDGRKVKRQKREEHSLAEKARGGINFQRAWPF